MAERKPAKKGTKTSPTTATGKASEGFTDEERAAMKERSQELKAAARRGPRAGKADGEHDVLAKIAEMPEPDRAMAERLHAIVKASAPALSPRTWYGMPAYAMDGKVVCFFQSAQKFKTRYATFGFSDAANLDEGAMWPTAFALDEVDRRRRGKDRRAREEGGQLRTAHRGLTVSAVRAIISGSRGCGASELGGGEPKGERFGEPLDPTSTKRSGGWPAGEKGDADHAPL